jgi:hypothetical protein
MLLPSLFTKGFFKKAGESEKIDKKTGAFTASLVESIEEYINAEFLKIVSSNIPDIIWDAAFTKEKNDFFYNFHVVSEQKSVRVAANNVARFISDYESLSILVPSDRCSTAMVSFLDSSVGDPQQEENAIQGAIPYDIERCDYATMRCYHDNGDVISIVSAFDSSVKNNFNDMLQLFFAQGGVVFSVVDRIFPLTLFVESQTTTPLNEGETMVCVEKRGDTCFVWNIIRLGNMVVPINSTLVKSSSVSNIFDDIRRDSTFLVNEMVRIYHHSPPLRGLLIDSENTSNNTTTTAHMNSGEEKNSAHRMRVSIIQSLTSGVSSLKNVEIVESLDAAITGARGGIQLNA